MRMNDERFRVFRMEDAPSFSETSCMEIADSTPVILEGLARAAAAGLEEGSEVKLLFAMPGMSLTYAWFKDGFPLPLHSHNADCLYYIVSGTLKLGSQQLGPGDGFYVGSDVPYTYRPGSGGVEVLEFRTADAFDIKFKGKTVAAWDRIVESLRAKRDDWKEQERPSRQPVISL